MASKPPMLAQASRRGTPWSIRARIPPAPAGAPPARWARTRWRCPAPRKRAAHDSARARYRHVTSPICGSPSGAVDGVQVARLHHDIAIVHQQQLSGARAAPVRPARRPWRWARRLETMTISMRRLGNSRCSRSISAMAGSCGSSGRRGSRTRDSPAPRGRQWLHRSAGRGRAPASERRAGASRFRHPARPSTCATKRPPLSRASSSRPPELPVSPARSQGNQGHTADYQRCAGPAQPVHVFL